MRFLLLVASGFFLFNCANKTQTKHVQFFDIDSLLNQQVAALSNLRAIVQKKTSVNNEQAGETAFAPDSAGWARELDVFREIKAINKPVLSDAYSVEIVGDTKSNLKVKVFKAKRETPVRLLQLYFLDSIPNIKRIEATIQEEYALQKSHRQMALHFDDNHQGSLLTKYSFMASQKMILTDSVSYFLEGVIQWPD